jgi:hypothetical protein
VTSAWLHAYVNAIGFEVPARAPLEGYPKPDAWRFPFLVDPPELGDAQRLAGHGLAVFPLVPGGKTPATANGFKDASRDASQLERWWPRSASRPFNLGVATGAASGVQVVDLDGSKGIASYASYVAAGLPKTWCAFTPGGVHLYFAQPEGEPLPNTAGKLGPGIDTRGDGGYVVAPPSRLGFSAAYCWLLAPWELEQPAPLPRKILDALRPRRPSTPATFSPRRSFAPDLDGAPWALQKLEAKARELAHAGKGARDAMLTAVAYWAGSRAREGHLRRSVAQAALLEAITSWGPVSSRDRSKVEKGIDAGLAGKG